MFYHNGDVYYGEWHNGEKNGQGKLYYENKDIYTGEWINNILMNGHVYKSYKIDGDLAGNYDGAFFNGLRHGFGIMRYNNEITYVGEWYNDEKDGFGYYINILNFEIYEGSFYLGLKHGEGFEFIYNPYDNSYFHAANYIDSLTEKQKRKLIEELIDPTLVENIKYKKTNQKLFNIPVIHKERETGEVSIRHMKLLKVCWQSLKELILFRINLNQYITQILK